MREFENGESSTRKKLRTNTCQSKYQIQEKVKQIRMENTHHIRKGKSKYTRVTLAVITVVRPNLQPYK